MPGILYAIPTPLGGAAADALPASALATVRTLRCFVVENAKSARAFLKGVGSDPKEMQILELNEKSDIQDLLKPLIEGTSVGLLSEAGCPAIADPGAALVAAAHGGRHPRRAAGRPVVHRARADGLRPRTASASRSTATCRAKRTRGRRRLPNSKRARAANGKPRSSSRRPTATTRCWAPCWRTARRDTLLCVASDLTPAVRTDPDHDHLGHGAAQATAIGKPPDRVPAAQRIVNASARGEFEPRVHPRRRRSASPAARRRSPSACSRRCPRP